MFVAISECKRKGINSSEIYVREVVPIVSKDIYSKNEMSKFTQ